MKKNDDEILSHDDDYHEGDDKTRQIRKLYVLHVMIETTADPKIICSAVHLSKNCTKKHTNILLQKRIKERNASAYYSKYIPPKYICKSASKQQQEKKRLIEEKAGCIYQNYKGYQIDEQKFLKKECDMRISRCVIPVE